MSEEEYPANTPTDSSEFSSPATSVKSGLGQNAPTKRTRIRKVRKTEELENWARQLQSVLERHEAPLISTDEMQKIREMGWTPTGTDLPVVDSLKVTHQEAWNAGKRGCLGTKTTTSFDIPFAPNKFRLFVLDGTDFYRFLSYFEIAENNQYPGEPLGCIGADDLWRAEWNYTKKSISLYRARENNKYARLAAIDPDFYDAMLVCLREMWIGRMVGLLEAKRRASRLEERRRLFAPDEVFLPIRSARSHPPIEENVREYMKSLRGRGAEDGADLLHDDDAE